jgi:hypothetical protein
LLHPGFLLGLSFNPEDKYLEALFNPSRALMNNAENKITS